MLMLLLADTKAFFDAAAIALPFLFVLALLAIPLGFGWDAGSKSKEIVPKPKPKPKKEDLEEAEKEDGEKSEGEGDEEQEEDESTIHSLTPYSGFMLFLWNFLTGGLYAIFWVNLQHGKLPKLRKDDPTTGQAMTRSLIPLLGLYGLPQSMGRLELRINEQRDFRDMPFKPLSAGLITMAVSLLLSLYFLLGLVAYFTGSLVDGSASMLLICLGAAPLIMNWLIFAPLTCWIIQSSVNSICEHDEEEAEEAEEVEEELEEASGDEEEEDQDESSDELVPAIALDIPTAGDEEAKETSDEPDSEEEALEEAEPDPEPTIDLGNLFDDSPKDE